MPETEHTLSESESLFFQLILMFQTAAYQQLGRIPNPLTQKTEKNLEQAKFSIDVLGMLEEKTKNNLSSEEATFLKDVLYELRMGYLEETKAGEQKSPT